MCCVGGVETECGSKDALVFHAFLVTCVTLINIAFVWLGGLGELLIFFFAYLLWAIALGAAIVARRERHLRNETRGMKSNRV